VREATQAPSSGKASAPTDGIRASSSRVRHHGTAGAIRASHCPPFAQLKSNVVEALHTDQRHDKGCTCKASSQKDAYWPNYRLPACVVNAVLIKATLHTSELPHRALTLQDHSPRTKSLACKISTSVCDTLRLFLLPQAIETMATVVGESCRPCNLTLSCGKCHIIAGQRYERV
jgi:hypothetical protein